MGNTLLTIFTPTYNRINELERLYSSLISQTDFRFEWLIVDDGSTDDTEKKESPLRRCLQPLWVGGIFFFGESA